MQKKTIKKVLMKKVKSWASSIDDETVKNDVLENVIITGGAIVSMLCKESPKDYDVYFRDRDSLHRVCEYYAKKYTEKYLDQKIKILDCEKDGMIEDENGFSIFYDGVNQKDIDEKRIKIFISGNGVAGDAVNDEVFEDVYNVLDEADSIDGDQIDDSKCKEKYKPIFFSSNAITLSNKIQIVARFFGEPDDIHKNYDFVHCKNYWTSWDDKIVLMPDALESIIEKRLYYSGSRYPVCSIIRMRKFINRGWQISAGEILKMVLNCNEYDLTNPDVLEDQLVGVDSAYFGIIIDAIKKKMSEDIGAKLSNSYIYSLIDRIF